MSRRERLACPECGHSVVVEIESRSGDWLLSAECEDCGVRMDAGIHSYAVEDGGA